MVSFRRSLGNNHHNNNSTASSSSASNHVVSTPLGRPADKVAPPQKVIRALKSHRSNNPQELSYAQGDFWYVTGEREGWYEALNPLVGSRGLVPMEDFEEFHKGGRASQSGSSRSQTPLQSPQSAPQPKRSRQPIYAIVRYDFHAERPDELDAKEGEALVIIAQSNHEWFVAKPIGRLGGPGLIPVAFVEIHDPVTGKPIESMPESIPMVEEWKKATAEYKAAAIPLGRFDLPAEQHVANSPYATQQSSQSSLPTPTQQVLPTQPSAASSQHSLPRLSSSAQSSSKPLYRPEQDPLLPPGEITSLAVPSFHNESGNYWFRLQVRFVPDEPSAPAYGLSLYRTYEDFYDFQISLLDTFPYEAGRPRSGEEALAPPERILPYMPGPVDEDIDDELTEYRRDELDSYVKALVSLRKRKAGYIIRDELCRSFFAAKFGDYCEDIPRADAVGELEERLAETRLSSRYSSSSRERGYDRAPSAASRSSMRSFPSQGQGHTSGPGHQRQESSRSSPLPPLETSRPASNSYAPLTAASSAGQSTASSFNAAPQQYAYAQQQQQQHAQQQQSQLPYQQQQQPASATVPGAGGQPPFVLIKIYDQTTDDLIGLRVRFDVSYAELLEKVRERLGPEVNVLKYRTGMGGQVGPRTPMVFPEGVGYQVVSNDQELRSWVKPGEHRLVLYVERG